MKKVRYPGKQDMRPNLIFDPSVKLRPSWLSWLVARSYLGRVGAGLDVRSGGVEGVVNQLESLAAASTDAKAGLFIDILYTYHVYFNIWKDLKIVHNIGTVFYDAGMEQQSVG